MLIIAKADRFRNCQQALEVLDKMGEGNLVCCNIPHVDRFTMTLFFALAERERLITSIRTKQALAVKKEQGAKLGNPLFIDAAKKEEAQKIISKATENSVKKRSENAYNDERNKRAYDAIRFMPGSLKEKADYLAERGYLTVNGNKFTPTSVKRLIDRYQVEPSAA